MQYIKKRGNVYYYRRRTPKALIQYFPHQEICKTLSNDYSQAKSLAIVITAEITHAIVSIQHGYASTVKSLEISPQSQKKQKTQKLSQLGKKYLATLTIGYEREKTYERIIATCSDIINDKISTDSMAFLKKTLEKLPRRNIQKYKVIPIKKLMKMNIPVADRVSPKNVKEYGVVINSVLKWAYQMEYLDRQYRVPYEIKTTAVRDERLPLTSEERKLLILELKKYEQQQLIRILFSSGLRLSELWKCHLVSHNGILCYDLTDKKIKLKTSTSRRLVPVHPTLCSTINDDLTLIKKKGSKYYSSLVNRMLGERKSLYSLRHNFATTLIGAQISEEIVAELMGHSHKTMTLQRYAKGFPLDILYEAVTKITIDF